MGRTSRQLTFSAAITLASCMLLITTLCSFSTASVFFASPTTATVLEDARSKCIDGRQIKMPVVRANGTFYQVGYAAGQQMKAQLTEFYSTYSDLVNIYLPFYSTQEGISFYNNYLNVTSRLCSSEFEELKGIADGSGVPLYKIFLMNISPEIDAYLEQKPHLYKQVRRVPESSQDCSTILINPVSHSNTTTFALLHNEDNAGEFSPYLYMINANVQLDNAGNFVNFTGMSYPGLLTGNAFAFNEHGIVLSSNALSPRGGSLVGIPRYFYKHMILLRSKTIDDVLKFIQSNPLAHGFSLNVVDNGGAMVNIELYPLTNGSVTFDVAYVGSQQHNDVDRIYHYNMYDRLNAPQIVANIVSSQHRSARANALPPANTIDDAKLILGDTADLDYPIYRTPAATDHECTLATASFDLRSRKLSVYRSNPHTAVESDALHFDLP